MRERLLRTLIDLQNELRQWRPVVQAWAHWQPLGRCEWCGSIGCPAVATVAWSAPLHPGNPKDQRVDYWAAGIGADCIAEVVELGVESERATHVEVLVDPAAIAQLALAA